MDDYCFSIKYLRNELQDAYEVGIKLYKKDAKKFDDLKNGLSCIPEECPWSLDNLIDEDNEYLLIQLPNNDKELEI